MKINWMFRVSLFFVLAPFIYLSFSFFPANAEIVDKIVAIVNDEIITNSDLNIAGQDLLQEISSAPKKDRKRKEIETKSLILDGLIEKKLMEQAAKRFGIRASEREVNNAIEDVKKRNRLNHEDFLMALSQSGISYDKYKKGIETDIIQAKFLEGVIKSRVSISEEELKEHYMKTEESFRIPSEVRLAQILFFIPEGVSEDERREVRNKAEMVLKMIREGEAFEELAAKFYEGPDADMGGDLGYIKKGEMNPDIEEVAFGLGIGEVSDLIETEIGVHIIKIMDIKEGAKKSFSEVKIEIEDILFKKKTEEIYQEWLKKMKATSHIEVKL